MSKSALTCRMLFTASKYFTAVGHLSSRSQASQNCVFGVTRPARCYNTKDYPEDCTSTSSLCCPPGETLAPPGLLVLCKFVKTTHGPCGAGLQQVHTKEQTENVLVNTGSIGTPDLSELSPQLQRQWHPENNTLGDIKVKPQSHKRVQWTCGRGPGGQPHIWVATVQARTSSKGCPYCQGRRACVHNSVATAAPDLVRYWNYDKNVETPEKTLAGSGARAEWKCPDCKHEWQADIHQRVLRNAGCPKCSSLRKPWNKQPTFEAAQHHLLSQWDHQQNAKEGIFPHNTTLGSDKQVHWICRQCPKGRLHQWRAKPYNRTRHRCSGCPCCDGKQVCVCNCLESLHPAIAAELDVSKNNFTAADVTAQSNLVVWWKSDARGSWEQRVHARTTYHRKLCRVKRGNAGPSSMPPS